MDQKYSRCPNKSITGEMTERQIDVKGMNINFQSSRGHIERWGEEHGKTIKVGDLIGWEDVESQSCPFQREIFCGVKTWSRDNNSMGRGQQEI